MTKFVNAAKGLKQVFAAQFLAIFGGIAGGLVLTSAFDGSNLAKGIFALVSVLLVVLALIVELVGLHKAGKDNINFNHAFTLALTTLFIEILVSILAAIWPNAFGTDVVMRVLGIITTILEIVGIYCVYKGIAELADARKEKGLANAARVLWNIIVVTLVGALVVSILALVGATTVAAILAIVVLVLGLISDIAFLVLLGKSMNRMA